MMTTDTDETIEAEADTDNAISLQRPIPGMDILAIVRDEVLRRALGGNPPAYAFIPVDLYLIAMAAHNVTSGFMQWVDADSGLNCYLIAYRPPVGTQPFVLADTFEQANEVYINSFPEGMLQHVPHPQEVPINGGDVPTECMVDAGDTVVETNNG